MLDGDPARVAKHLPPVGDAHDHRVDPARYRMDPREARDAFVLPDARRPLGRRGQRARDRGHEPRTIVLHDVIDRSPVQRLDGPLLADRRRDEDEGNVGRARANDLERPDAVEAREAVVGENEVRPELRQRRAQRGLGVDPQRFRGEPALAKVAREQLGVLHDVLDQQHANGARSHVNPTGPASWGAG